MNITLLRFWIVSTIFIVLPFGVLDPFWWPKAACYLIGAAFFIPGSTYRESDPALDWLLRYIAIMFIFYITWPILSARPDASGQGAHIAYEPWRVIPSLIAITSLLLINRLQILTESQWIQVAWTLTLCAALTSMIGILQYFRIYQWIVPAQDGSAPSRMVSIFGNQMLTANFLAIVAPLFLMFRKWWLGWLLCLSAILLAGNNAGTLALLLGLATFFTMQRHVWIPAILGAGTLILCGFAYPHMNDGGRFSMIHQALDAWKDGITPYFGYGLCRLYATFNLTGKHTGSAFASTHNEWVDGLFEIGIVGMGIAIWFMARLIKRVWVAKPNITLSCYTASLVSAACVSMFSFPLKVAGVLITVILAIAACLSLSTGGKHGYVPA